jgi:uncharacterized protein YndB with AHSA1/START domain
MNTKNQTQVIKDQEAKSILVSREFNAPIDIVWRAYTEKELLDKWWGPSPWRAETKILNFYVGGYWLYAMVGPENQKQWGRMNYIGIDYHRSFNLEDVFCDEEGNTNFDLPISKGQISFYPSDLGTKVDFKTWYSTEVAIQKLIEMGFEQGITACYEQLEELLKKMHYR